MHACAQADYFGNIIHVASGVLLRKVGTYKIWYLLGTYRYRRKCARMGANELVTGNAPNNESIAKSAITEMGSGASRHQELSPCTHATEELLHDEMRNHA